MHFFFDTRLQYQRFYTFFELLHVFHHLAWGFLIKSFAPSSVLPLMSVLTVPQPGLKPHCLLGMVVLGFVVLSSLHPPPLLLAPQISSIRFFQTECEATTHIQLLRMLNPFGVVVMTNLLLLRQWTCHATESLGYPTCPINI